MLLPITATPRLTGKDALNFWKEIEENDNKKSSIKITKESLETYQKWTRELLCEK